MLFSLGGHPAFKCPVNEGEEYEDYYLEFEKTENAATWLLEKDGLVGRTTKPMIENSDILPLKSDMFDNDALIFKNLNSTSVSLKSKKSSQVVHVDYTGFPYLGIWAKPNAHFVCINHGLVLPTALTATRTLKPKKELSAYHPKKLSTPPILSKFRNNYEKSMLFNRFILPCSFLRLRAIKNENGGFKAENFRRVKEA